MKTTQPDTRRLATIYLLLGFAQAAHSIEEMRTHFYEFLWTLTGFFHSFLPGFPQFRMDSVTFAVVNMAFITLLLGTVPFVHAGRRSALFLAGVAGVIETLNGGAHITAAVVLGDYVPGLTSAPLLLILGFFLLRELYLTGRPSRRP